MTSSKKPSRRPPGKLTALQRYERAFKGRCSRLVRFQGKLRRTFSRPAPSIFVTSMPKSGSTFLSRALEEVSGYIPYFLGYKHLNEQDLYLPRVIDAWNMTTVSHQHTRASAENLRLMAEFRIKPVILTRDIFDCLVSQRDHFLRESADTPLFTVGPDFADLSDEQQMDLMVDLVCPWYVRFLDSWFRAEVEGLWLTYEEATGQTEAALARIAAFYGLSWDEERIAAAVARVGGGEGSKTRFSVGRSGRGAEMMSPRQQKRVRRLFDYCPAIRQEIIGL